MARTITLLLAMAVAALAGACAPASAAAHDTIHVGSAVVRADEGLLELTVRCNAPPVRCRGRLTADTIDEVPLTVAREVRLPRGRARRLDLRLRQDGLRALSDAGSEKLIGVALKTPHARHPLRGYRDVRAQVTCATGTTVVSTPAIRVFRLEGFGLYACSDPHRRPDLVLAEDTGFAPAVATNVAAAGSFISYVDDSSGGKCGSSVIVVYDARAHRTVRQIPSATVVDGPANGCTGVSHIVASVLRPSGAFAWIEAPGDTGQVAVRAADADGVIGTLDLAAGIDQGSLHLIAPSSVGWTRDGTPRSAPLP